MKVTLGPLARSAFEEKAGGDVAASVRAALVHYAGKLQNGRPPAAYPTFLPPVPAGREPDPSVELEIEVDRKLEAEFQRQAAEQGMDVSALATHAVLIYVAEVDRAESHGRALRDE